MAALLEATGVIMQFGGLTAVNKVDLSLEPQSIVSLIGPNGAGKTTFFNVIAGIYTPTGGSVMFNGQALAGVRGGKSFGTPTHEVTQRGLARTYQNIRLFGSLTALENVLVGMHCRMKSGFFSSIFRTPGQRQEEKDCIQKASELLAYVGIPGRENVQAQNLPYGEQRLLEIARALASEPKLLLLDEPAAGMNPTESEELRGLIGRLRNERKLTIFLIEHDMKVVMRISDRVAVLDYGAKIADGTPEEVQKNPRVIQAYLERKPSEVMLIMALLEVHNIETYYGNIRALHGVSLTIDEGEIVTLIGANGAGKTTTLRTISGLIRPRKGQITFKGTRIDTIAPDKIVRLGISQSPEGRKIFARMTVQENLEMGAFLRSDTDGIKQDMEYAFGLFPRLKERLTQKGGTLSGGEQQMLAVARALMARPQLLLLDEPSMGLAPLLIKEIFDTVVAINKKGTPILLVEQNATMALSIAHRAYVLETGNIVMEGPASRVASDEKVKEAYLGI